jgi:spore maturation protein CgeB
MAGPAVPDNIMRVLIIGRSKIHTAEAAIHRSLTALGHQSLLLDDRRLRQRIGAKLGSEYIRMRANLFKPDRIIMFKPHDVTLDTVADLCARTPAVMWYRDLTIPPDPELVARAPFFETVFLTAGGQAAEWEARGARRALFLPDCADPKYETVMPPVAEWSADVGFIGRGARYDDRRVQLLLRIAEQHSVRVWGQAWEPYAQTFDWHGETAYGHDFGRACASVKITLGANVLSPDSRPVPLYQSNRMVKVLASAGFFLGHAAPGLTDIFIDDEHCAWYENADHAMAQIERYLGDERARERIRMQGHSFLLEHHTFENRLHNLLTGEPWQNPLTGTSTPVQRLASVR